MWGSTFRYTVEKHPHALAQSGEALQVAVIFICLILVICQLPIGCRPLCRLLCLSRWWHIVKQAASRHVGRHNESSSLVTASLGACEVSLVQSFVKTTCYSWLRCALWNVLGASSSSITAVAYSPCCAGQKACGDLQWPPQATPMTTSCSKCLGRIASPGDAQEDADAAKQARAAAGCWVWFADSFAVCELEKQATGGQQPYVLSGFVVRRPTLLRPPLSVSECGRT